MLMPLMYVLPFVTAGLFYKLGALADADRMGGHSAGLWATVSAAGWGVSLFVLHWPVFYGLALQFGLLVGVFVLSTVWAAVRGGYHVK